MATRSSASRAASSSILRQCERFFHSAVFVRSQLNPITFSEYGGTMDAGLGRNAALQPNVSSINLVSQFSGACRTRLLCSQYPMDCCTRT